jgi:hypothetical protein
MEKSLLLRRLAEIREEAESVHLDIVVGIQLVADLEAAGNSAENAKVELQALKMQEQKHLRELDWILDQLEHVHR